MWKMIFGQRSLSPTVPSVNVPLGIDEQHCPRILFSDPSESIHLSDFSGDGLVDIVRIRNGDICYWPNLGYGRFGPKVVMENAPIFSKTHDIG
jgi:hypothetical protein